jgi:uncharacterized protein DUF4232
VLAALLLTAVTAAAPPCHSSQLRLVYHRTDGALGTLYELMRLEARPGVTCTMGGYPGVSLLGRHGRVLPIHVGRETASRNPPRTQTFEPGRSARFSILHPSASPRTTKACRTRVYFFRVIPPNETHALTVRIPRRPARFCRLRARVTPVGRHY